MEFKEVGALLGLFATISTLGVIYTSLVARIAKLEVKVDTMWDFQLRRGVTEGLRTGTMQKNSPVKITEKAKQLFEPFVDKLRLYYETFGKHVSDKDFTLMIERRFGRELVDKICIPEGLHESSCLLIALAIAKGQDLVMLLTPETKLVVTA